MTVCSSQSTDIVRLEYTEIPENDNGIKTSRYRFLVNLPTALGPDDYLITGAEYSYIDFDVTRSFPFDDSELQKLHVVDLNLGYITKWNANWRFIGIVTPRLASNFISGIESDDFRLNLTAVLLKHKKDGKNPFRLFVGLTFNSATGLPVPLPLISYQRRFHPNWSYNFGVPRMHLRYHIKDRHILQLGVLLDGYFVNVQNAILLPDDNLGSSISLSAIVGTLGYQYNFAKNISLYSFIGHSLVQNGLLRNNKRNRVFLLNDKGNIYFRAGFKIAIF